MGKKRLRDPGILGQRMHRHQGSKQLSNIRGIAQLSRNVSNPVPGHMPNIPVSSPGKKEIEEIEKD